ncbi:MAG: hypothetical protein AB1486_14715 [Planctomycetota bacterium]
MQPPLPEHGRHRTDYLIDLRTSHHGIILPRPRALSIVIFCCALLVVGVLGAYWTERPAWDSLATADVVAGLHRNEANLREQAIEQARVLLDPALVPELTKMFEGSAACREFLVAATTAGEDGVLARFTALERHERKLIVFALSGYRLESCRAFFEAVLAVETAPEVRNLAAIAIYRLDRLREQVDGGTHHGLGQSR